MALQEHRGSDVVALGQVVEQFVQQISMIWTLPKVMMSINNWQGRFGHDSSVALASQASSGGYIRPNRVDWLATAMDASNYCVLPCST